MIPQDNFCFCIEKKKYIYVLTTGSSLDTLHQTWYPKVNGKNHLDFCRGNQCDANFQVGPGFTLTHVSISIFIFFCYAGSNWTLCQNI